MSVEQQTVQTGSPQADSPSALQFSQCAASCNIAVMMEATVAAPDFVAGCPDPGTAASPNHTHTTCSPAKPEATEQTVRGNDNIQRRNSFPHPKQQQMKLTKRRITTTSGFKHPNASKKRRRTNSESDSVLPSNFQLGGNIFDPLNLNSLLDEEVNRALNAETPKSSPLPSKNRDPVEILIPRDITDPLNLNSGVADSSVLVSSYRSGGRKRHRNRHHGGSATSATQLNLSESGKCESKTSVSALLPAMLTSCPAVDVSKEPKGSSVTGDSHEHSADSSCKEETMHLCVDTLTSPISGGLHQHTSRRKRRRNSGKVEPPLTHSTPVVKMVSGDRSWDTGGSRKSQSFHTPRRGPKIGPGGHQQSYNHTKDQRKKKFQYGNYDKYYGYRNPGALEDSRVQVLLPEWFRGKNVLDLGCNSGHLTLYIAKMFRPARILGLDIDSSLIHVARKNIRHYLSELQTQEARCGWQERKHNRQEERNESQRHTDPDKKQDEEGRSENGETVKGDHDPSEAVNDTRHTDKPETSIRDNKAQEVKREDFDLRPTGHSVSCSFPMSLLITRGPIAPPPLTEMTAAQPGVFPSNVSFVTANYVLTNDDLLLTQRPEYDVILCLSVTKWVHLNWGDCGLKRLFQRVYRHLHPGGLFILEPQPWESYTRRKKLTDNIRKNYNSIHLKPDHFTEYLINEVGFTSFRCLEASKCSVKGFQRPIYIFHK